MPNAYVLVDSHAWCVVLQQCTYVGNVCEGEPVHVVSDLLWRVHGDIIRASSIVLSGNRGVANMHTTFSDWVNSEKVLGDGGQVPCKVEVGTSSKELFLCIRRTVGRWCSLNAVIRNM